MIFLKFVSYTIILYVILNFSKLRKKDFSFRDDSLILPVSLGLAITLVDSLLRVAFHYAAIFFVIIAGISYFIFNTMLRKKGR